MPDPAEPLIQECSTCGALIDVSDEEPLALMHCPTCGAAMRVRTRFGHFELLEIMGAGGMGAVYRALDTTLNRSLALKLLRREYSEQPEFITQFEHEAALTALINHPNVVKVYSTGSDHGLFYIAMELVDKGSLDDLMSLQKKVSEPQVLEVGIQIAQGLRAAYQRGLIHRDVKPGNILFADAHHAKIVDFGLAAPIESASEVGGEVWGTPYYVAPEKLEHPPLEDLRSDIYSLGATLFHAIAGRPPYEAEDASMVALRHLKSQPVSLQTFAPWASSSTAYVINRTLQKDPDQRYATYDELIEHLEYARNELLTKPVPTAANRKPTARPRVVMEDAGQQKALSFITLFVLLALVAGGVYIYRQRDVLFPKPEKKRPGVQELARKATGEVQPRYEAARKMLIAGEDLPAADEFRKLAATPLVPQPMLDWITFHAGLARVLAGKLEESHEDFQKLSEYGPYSVDPFEKEFSDFMTALAKRMLDENSVPVEETTDFNRQTYQCIGLLAYGVKNWELGELEMARALFRQFESASPETPDDWIAQYKKIPARYQESFDRYEKFAEMVKGAGEAEKAKAQLPKLKAALEELKLTGAMLRKGKSLLRKVQQTVDDFEAEEKAAMAEMESSDEKTIAETKAKADALCTVFKFKEAVSEAKAAQIISDKGKLQKKDLIKHYDWLVTFKSQLTHDLGTTPYPGGIARKTGGGVPGQVSDADDQNLIIKLPKGNLSVAWTDAAYEGLVAMAKSYLRTDLPPDRLADKLWTLGVFCDFFGHPKDASAYFAQAAKLRPQYTEEWKQFPNVPPA